MKTIWKFPLTGPFCTLSMPAGAKILHCGPQFELPCLWVMVESDAPKVERRFVTIGTGHPFDDAGADYLGTVMLQGGTLVLHVFEPKR